MSRTELSRGFHAPELTPVQPLLLGWSWAGSCTFNLTTMTPVGRCLLVTVCEGSLEASEGRKGPVPVARGWAARAMGVAFTGGLRHEPPGPKKPQPDRIEPTCSPGPLPASVLVPGC